MPIRPERMHAYPGGSIRSPEWRAIRSAVGERSGWRCETCAAPHMTMVARGFYGDREAYMVLETCEVFCAESGLQITTLRATSEFNARRVLKIVLTVAHRDHDEGNSDPANLAHWCQRHHLRHDKHQHATNAARTRRAKSPQMDLEDLLT